MKSRIAVLSLLVAGMLFSTTGAGLAVTGLAGNDQASVAQYGDDQQVRREQVGPVPAVPRPRPFVIEEIPDVIQPSRQVEFGAAESGDQLPFTGLAAIPVLLLGVALLGAGGLLHRRTG